MCTIIKLMLDSVDCSTFDGILKVITCMISFLLEARNFEHLPHTGSHFHSILPNVEYLHD